MASRWLNVLVDVARAVVKASVSSSGGSNAAGTTAQAPSPATSTAPQESTSRKTTPQKTSPRKGSSQDTAPRKKKSRSTSSQATQSARPRPPASSSGSTATASSSVGYPGDYLGVVEAEYAPHPDGEPDPGEIVWTWVPYEEDHSQGKDRPVLLVGRDGPWLLALQLTSQDHDRDAQQEARAGRLWMDIGTGPWDKQGRPSEVRLNRVIRVAPDEVRREGAVMAKALFVQVTAAMAKALA